MLDISFYQSCYGIATPEAAYQKFVGSLQTYYDADYYVNWNKVLANVKPFRRELTLLSTLCDEPDKEAAARELLCDYPQVIRALPILIACRGKVEIADDAADAEIRRYSFSSSGSLCDEQEVEHYVRFLSSSGLLALLGHIKSVSDYVTGVEVGLDSNARKNRSGDCGIRAIHPFVQQAQVALPQMQCKYQANFDFMAARGCRLPVEFQDVIWDWAFWTTSGRFAVMEVNHYGSSGSKPIAIAHEYIKRQAVLKSADIDFIWVTDGLGWKHMLNALQMAFYQVKYLVNVRLAADGQMEWVLRESLS